MRRLRRATGSTLYEFRTLPARSVRLTQSIRHHMLAPWPAFSQLVTDAAGAVSCRDSQKGLHYETNIALHRVGALGAGGSSPECARVQLDGRIEGRQTGV